MQDIRRASIRELAHKIKGYGTPRFAFFLGAGASRQSGILVAGEMIRYFKEQITAQSCPAELKTEEDRTKWLAEQDWYKADGSEYCKCFEKFEPKEFGRQRYIESIIEKHEPSFGYVVLANLMAGEHINTIITTNFDDLVYSACTTFTGIRPIVYAYGVLASEMRLAIPRPKILKLHGDYLYSALMNTGTELASQDSNMARQMRQVLSEYGLIVVGYSGGDKSVMDILSEMSERNDLYWCIRRGDKINADVEKLLRDKGGFLVEIEGFDEMMNEVRRIVEFDVKKMLGSIEERRNQIIKHLEKFESQYSEDILGEIVEAAKEPTEKAREDKKINALDFVLRGNKAYERKDFSEAEKLYQRAIAINPNYAAGYAGLGNALGKLKRYGEAEAAYRRAIELDPNYVNAHNNLGNMLAELKRYDEAEAAYRKAVDLNPSYALAHNNLGIVLADLKRYGEAEAAYRRAIELDPNYVNAHNNLGNMLRDLKRYGEAEAAYRRAIELDPNNALAHNNLGIVLADLKRYDEAEAAYRKAMELDQNNALAHNNLGNTLADLKRYGEAEAAYRRAIELDPNYALAHNNLGNMLRDLKRYGEAEAAYRRAIELDPDYAGAYGNLIILLRFLSRETEAIAVAESALSLGFHTSSHLLSLAALYKKLGNTTAFEQYAAQARDSLNPDDWYNLACLESVLGNTDAAIDNLRQAAQLAEFDREWAGRDPDFEWIRDDPRFKEIVGE